MKPLSVATTKADDKVAYSHLPEGDEGDEEDEGDWEMRGIQECGKGNLETEVTKEEKTLCSILSQFDKHVKMGKGKTAINSELAWLYSARAIDVRDKELLPFAWGIFPEVGPKEIVSIVVDYVGVAATMSILRQLVARGQKRSPTIRQPRAMCPALG